MWESIDRSGRIVIDRDQSSYTWRIGKTRPLPHVLWIKGVALTPQNDVIFSVELDEQTAQKWKQFPKRIGVLYPKAISTTAPASQPTTRP